MKRKLLNIIGFSFVLGAICRYLYFILYGYFYILIEHFKIEQSFIGLLPKTFKPAAFHFQNIIEILIVASVSSFIPVVVLGYYLVASKKQYWLYSIATFVGIICFDVFYYRFVINDIDMLISNYSPVWFAMLVAFEWIVLFYGLYSLGNYLRCKRNRDGSPLE